MLSSVSTGTTQHESHHTHTHPTHTHRDGNESTTVHSYVHSRSTDRSHPSFHAIMRRVLQRAMSTATRLSSRGQALAAGGGAAAGVWEAVNALAAKPGMINMGQGFPDFAGSLVAAKLQHRRSMDGSASLNQYSPQPGLPKLRHSVSNFVQRRYGAQYDPMSEVIITTEGRKPSSGILCLSRARRRSCAL